MQVFIFSSVPFQSTPPCGGDSAAGFSAAPRPDFNPRPLAGATFFWFCRRFISFLFQSTPPCGGDLNTAILALDKNDFNPRPLAGATYTFRPGTGHYRYFNPRPLAGATSRCCRCTTGGSNFNPRPLAGATKKGVLADGPVQFQSTPPCGGDSCD